MYSLLPAPRRWYHFWFHLELLLCSYIKGGSEFVVPYLEHIQYRNFIWGVNEDCWLLCKNLERDGSLESILQVIFQFLDDRFFCTRVCLFVVAAVDLKAAIDFFLTISGYFAILTRGNPTATRVKQSPLLKLISSIHSLELSSGVPELRIQTIASYGTCGDWFVEN